MQPPTIRRSVALAALTLALLCVFVAAGAAGEGPKPRDCGTVVTGNGGSARFVRAVRTPCRLARRVAKRANGRRYRALGFRCRPRRRPGVAGKVYGCGRVSNGRGQGVGFVYRAR